MDQASSYHAPTGVKLTKLKFSHSVLRDSHFTGLQDGHDLHDNEL